MNPTITPKEEGQVALNGLLATETNPVNPDLSVEGQIISLMVKKVNDDVRLLKDAIEMYIGIRGKTRGELVSHRAHYAKRFPKLDANWHGIKQFIEYLLEEGEAK